MGDKPYDAKTSPGYRSASRAGQPWKGDIAGRRIRGRNYSSHKEGKIILPSAAKDRYGLGSARIGIFQGNIKGKRKAEKGGGSVSGQAWNNMGYPIGGGVPRNGQRIAGFQGNLKGRRPEKGGGSVSGQVWNNNEHPIGGGAPSQGSRVARFQGTIKGKRPEKGGGSVSGRVWNNNGQPIGGGSPSQGAGVAVFRGNIKTRRPEKGGGSVSGKPWNNGGQPIIVRVPKEGARAALFQGNIKARRPEKGGGSVSGKLWNNKETPIPGTTPPLNARRIGGYPGRYKLFELQPGFSDQGELFTGYIKLKKFRKNYVQNPNSAEDAIKQQRPNKTTKQAGGLQVKVKRPDYIQNENASDDALLKKRPSRNTYQAGELQVRVKEKAYGKKPNAADDALPGIKPMKSSIKASEYARSLRRTWDYVHNPSSAEEALKTREPGKAFARSAAYQGNIKMQKYVLFERNRALHPDTKFIKTNKNNVDEERDMLTNFKLWWARLFKKQETQPENLKYKGKKPRYDKGEAGMWNE